MKTLPASLIFPGCFISWDGDQNDNNAFPVGAISKREYNGETYFSFHRNHDAQALNEVPVDSFGHFSPQQKIMVADRPYTVKIESGNEVEVTVEQMAEVQARLKSDPKAVFLGPQIGGYVAMEWCGMYLGIEKDGYAHT